MTNAVSFSQTERIIHLDTHRWSQIVIGLSLTVAILLGLWFLFGTVTLAIESDDVTFLPDGTFAVVVPDDQLTQIQLEQAAIIQVSDGQQTLTVSAEVIRITPDAENDLAEIGLLADLEREQVPTLLQRQSAYAQIITGQYRPYTLVTQLFG